MQSKRAKKACNNMNARAVNCIVVVVVSSGGDDNNNNNKDNNSMVVVYVCMCMCSLYGE